MKTPICIISYNRSFYLDSLLASLQYELIDFDIIVCDNGSTEQNMASVLEKWEKFAEITILRLPGGDWINDEYKAKNAFISHCADKYNCQSYIFLQDDLQYVGPAGYLKSVVDDVNESGFLNVAITGVRMSTLQSQLSGFRVKNIWQVRDNHFGTIGIHRKEVFDIIGPYSQSYPITKEYWGRGEDDYHERVIRHYGKNHNIAGFVHTPVFVGVWNDPRGHYSFLRANKRYGHYLPVMHGYYTYYEHMSSDVYNKLQSSNGPSGFINVAKPLGWSYKTDLNGDQMKYPQSSIIQEGPVAEVI
jgi:hypothetical protein